MMETTLESQSNITSPESKQAIVSQLAHGIVVRSNLEKAVVKGFKHEGREYPIDTVGGAVKALGQVFSRVADEMRTEILSKIRA